MKTSKSHSEIIWPLVAFSCDILQLFLFMVYLKVLINLKILSLHTLHTNLRPGWLWGQFSCSYKDLNILPHTWIWHPHLHLEWFGLEKKSSMYHQICCNLILWKKLRRLEETFLISSTGHIFFIFYTGLKLSTYE